MALEPPQSNGLFVKQLLLLTLLLATVCLHNNLEVHEKISCLFIQHVLCGSHYSRPLKYLSDQAGSCWPGVHILVGDRQ